MEFAAFSELTYSLYCLASFFAYWAFFIGFYYVGSYATNVLHAHQSTGIDLLMVINGIGIPARLIQAYVAQRYTGPLNLIIPIITLTGIVLYSWTAVTSVAGLWVIAAFYGIGANGLQTMFPLVLTSLTKDPAKQGARTGMGFSIAGLAALTGPPIAGAILEGSHSGYLGLQLFAGTGMMVGAAIFLCTRYVAVGWHRAKI